MKTEIFKKGLPIMAFLMAIAFAFATEKNETSKEPEAIYYIMQNGLCSSVDTDCNRVSSIPCVYGVDSKQVFEKRLNSTTCDVPLTHLPRN
jgi:hypothetical protein